MEPQIRTIGQIPAVWAKRQADSPALIADGRTWTWAQLDAEANQVAHALARDGIQPGDRIAYLDKNAPAFFPLLYGAARLGAVLVAVNWRLAPAELSQIIEDCDSRLLFVGDEFSAQVAQIGLPGDTRSIGLGDSHTFAEWLGGQPTEPVRHTPAGADPCLQLYSSGTTGVPKGIVLSHDNVLAQLRAAAVAWHFDRTCVSLVCMPLYHIAGSGTGVLSAYAGATTVLLREADPDAILWAISEHGVTNVLLVPTVIHTIVRSPAAEKTDFSTLRAVIYGGSPISEEILQRALETFGSVLVGAYGCTETAGAFTCLGIEDHDVHRPELLRSCGREWTGAEVRIVDVATHLPVPDGVVGEIEVRSVQVMTGYWRRPQATAEVMTPDGFYRTGDAGSMRDGYVYIQDRLKDMIITGGENVYPAEVENVLMAHPGVADCAVIGVPDEQWGENVLAVVIPEDPTLDPQALIAWCRERIAHYKCPKVVEWTDALPRNPSGKVLKKVLRSTLASRPESG